MDRSTLDEPTPRRRDPSINSNWRRDARSLLFCDRSQGAQTSTARNDFSDHLESSRYPRAGIPRRNRACVKLNYSIVGWLDGPSHEKGDARNPHRARNVASARPPWQLLIKKITMSMSETSSMRSRTSSMRRQTSSMTSQTASSTSETSQALAGPSRFAPFAGFAGDGLLACSSTRTASCAINSCDFAV